MIQCYICHSVGWCIWNQEEKDWICEQCFLKDGGTKEEWNQINKEAKERRDRKRREQAAREMGEVDPDIHYSSTTTQKPRACKFGCQANLIWDDRIEGRNKFVESESKIPHTSIRCQALQHALRQKGVDDVNEK